MKYYIVELCTGDWDGVSWKDIFITDKEDKAKKYCERGNDVLKKYKDYYAELLQQVSIDVAGRKDDYVHISDRREFTDGVFSYHEIEFRPNVKIK